MKTSSQGALPPSSSNLSPFHGKPKNDNWTRIQSCLSPESQELLKSLRNQNTKIDFIQINELKTDFEHGLQKRIKSGEMMLRNLCEEAITRHNDECKLLLELFNNFVERSLKEYSSELVQSEY